MADEARRLGTMAKEKQELEAEDYEVLWFKTLPIFGL